MSFYTVYNQKKVLILQKFHPLKNDINIYITIIFKSSQIST